MEGGPFPSLEPGETLDFTVRYSAPSTPRDTVSKHIRVYSDDPLQREYTITLQATIVE